MLSHDMRSIFHARRINDPFGDPGVYVDIPWEGRGLLFDLGANYHLGGRRLLKVSDVFVSHAHLDHFIGFDHFFRHRLGRERPFRLFGPPGIIERVEGKLAGYSWNLIEEYPVILDVIELGARGLRAVRLSAKEHFRREELEQRALFGDVPLILEDELFEARATLLDHRILCAAYAVSENAHVNINRVALEKMGLPKGPWLRALKEKVRAGAADDTVIRVPGGSERPLGALRDAIVSITRGQKIAYVVDAAFSAGNVQRILELIAGADLLFCEAPFLERDVERARNTYHLTALQAGWLARRAAVSRLEVFHFSPRYENEPEALALEAEDGFRGAREPALSAEIRALGERQGRIVEREEQSGTA